MLRPLRKALMGDGSNRIKGNVMFEDEGKKKETHKRNEYNGKKNYPRS
jgi:hypothetical protein